MCEYCSGADDLGEKMRLLIASWEKSIRNDPMTKWTVRSVIDELQEVLDCHELGIERAFEAMQAEREAREGRI